jgi:hypothetical protein
LITPPFVSAAPTLVLEAYTKFHKNIVSLNGA